MATNTTNWYFSANELTFYAVALKPAYDAAGSWPNDAVLVSDADRTAFGGLPPSGKMLGAVNGAPAWVTAPPVPLDMVQARQIAILTGACNATIVGGYRSNALGVIHIYPSTVTDQANMQASVISSLLPDLPSDWHTPFWCADSNGNWTMVAHTASQIQQAGSDGKAMIVTAQLRLVTLSTTVMTATTASAVTAVVW